MADIWGKALGSSVENVPIESIITKPNYYHKMTRQEINNYMSSHDVETINKNTLLDFFGPNIYDTVEGCKHYFAHEICNSYYGIDKIYNALEASFEFLGPNTGELNYGENYFQTFMFNYRAHNYHDLDDKTQIMIINALLELGFQYGLDPNFRTIIEGNTMWHYLCLAIKKFTVLKNVFDNLTKQKINCLIRNFLDNSILIYLLLRVTSMYNIEDDSWKKELIDYYINEEITEIPIIFFNKLREVSLMSINKEVREDTGSLLKKYGEAEKKYHIRVQRVKIDPLLQRFLIKFNLLRDVENAKAYDEDYGMKRVKAFSLSRDFGLPGYDTLANFLEFYAYLFENFNYNRGSVESVKALKKILKKENENK